jgi:DNA-binding transcriptional MocR family regulator
MSVEAIAWAFKQHVGKPSAKLVLVNLADHADGDRKCWPSLRKISERTELSRDTVVRSIRLLKSRGFITVVHRHNRRSRSSNVYYLNCEADRVHGAAGVLERSAADRSSTAGPPQADGPPTAIASSDEDSSSTRTAVAAAPAPNRHIESSKEALPPSVPRRGTSLDELNTTKEWMNQLFGRKRAWSHEEDHLLSVLLPISPDERELLSWGYGLPCDPDGWVYIHGNRATRRKENLVTLLREFPSEVDKWRSVRSNGEERQVNIDS